MVFLFLEILIFILIAFVCIQEEVAKIKTRSNSQDDVVLVKDSSKGPRLSREVHWPEKTFDEAYTSLRVNKKHKEVCIFELMAKNLIFEVENIKFNKICILKCCGKFKILLVSF